MVGQCCSKGSIRDSLVFSFSMDEKEVKCFTIIYKKSKDKFGEEFSLILVLIVCALF
jgi:hypothetical protein